jgi:hypothetical protein
MVIPGGRMIMVVLAPYRASDQIGEREVDGSYIGCDFAQYRHRAQTHMVMPPASLGVIQP